MTFLQYVTKDILAKHTLEELSDIAVVFPNKRAALFLNEALFMQNHAPLWTPTYITISDLFRRHSPLEVPDQIWLILKLYDTYREVTGSQEPLDHFYAWGQLMLSDFDDIDKNLVEASKLFVNLEAYQSMRDFSFLDERQRKSLSEFFGTVMDDTALQHEFNDIWKHLGNIYDAYRALLKAEGKAYEGMLYREVVEAHDIDFRYRKYIFIGFNLLQKVEQQLFQMLKDQGKAAFYWDYDVYYMRQGHEAGHFISQYLDQFPNELSPGRVSPSLVGENIYDHLGEASKKITYISAPTENIQARYVAQWLNEGSRWKDGKRTAIVLADEKLLQAVVHSLPQNVESVNITTGYPLSASPASSFVQALVDLQIKGKAHGADTYRGKYLTQVLRHPFAKYLSDECAPLLASIITEHRNYPTRDWLTNGRGEAIATLFEDIKPTDGVLPLLPWLAKLLKLIGAGAAEDKDPLLHEAIFRTYSLVNRLNAIMAIAVDGQPAHDPDGRHLVSTSIVQRLLRQLIASTTIPFHGEPARGLQIMGVLETRNLDFDHLLLLSANEGNLPKGVNDASFIPHTLRRGYELTTIENKVSIYSYYFHALLQRADDVTLTFNSATDDGRQGEMSRFMLQFMVESASRHPIRRLTLQAGQDATLIVRHPIQKTSPVMQCLLSLEKLSPTSLNRYLRCQLQFYYHVVCQLHEPEEYEEDEIDARTFGNIFHRAAELAYIRLSGEKHRNKITASSINALLKDDIRLDGIIEQAFREELFGITDPSISPRYNGLQLLNRKVIKLYLIQLLQLDEKHTPFDILALEEKHYDKMSFRVGEGEKEILLGGQIDRLDKTFVDGKETIRVVDYKTGTPLSTLPADVEEIFNPKYIDSHHGNYYLQTFLYACAIRDCKEWQTYDFQEDFPVAPALLFIRQTSQNGYDPILAFKKQRGKDDNRIGDIAEVEDTFKSYLKRLLEEIYDSQLPFTPTADAMRCNNCPYNDICGL